MKTTTAYDTAQTADCTRVRLALDVIRQAVAEAAEAGAGSDYAADCLAAIAVAVKRAQAANSRIQCDDYDAERATDRARRDEAGR